MKERCEICRYNINGDCEYIGEVYWETCVFERDEDFGECYDRED